MSFWKKKSDQAQDVSAPESLGTTSVSPVSAVVSKAHAAREVVAPAASSPDIKTATTTTANPTRVAEVTHSPLPGPNSKPEDVLTERFGKTRSALGEGTVIQGKLSFDTPVRIDGKLSGEIFSSKVLIIGPTGRIDAAIEAATLVILGKVTGTIAASERVELWGGSSFSGTVKSPVLVVQEGSEFSGASQMLALHAGLESSRKPSVDPSAAHTRTNDTPKPASATAAPPASAGKSGVAASSSEPATDVAKKEARVH